MPSKDSHIKLANRCQDSLSCLLAGEENHSEWVTTIAFYKAIHIVEAVFSHQNLSHGRNHEARERLLKTTASLKHIYKMYHPLWNASTVARYLAVRNGSTYQTFDDFIPPADVERMMVNHYLNQIEQSAEKILGADSGLCRCR